MAGKKFGYIHDIDDLIEQTGIEQVLSHYGEALPETSNGEHRMQCVFNESCHDSQYGNLTVRLNDKINRIFCHTCQVRGNLLTLIHGFENHTAPAGGRLRGDEFKSAVDKLREIADVVPSERSPTPPATNQTVESPPPKLINVPLVKHAKEAARALADLHEDLITDVSQMSPEAAQYVRKRPWMTPQLMQKWGVGWIPGNGRSLFRKHYLVYTHRNERGDVLSYSGRDLQFEKKWQTWTKGGRSEGKKPNKHCYVSGYHKGQELYGGQAARLEEPYVRESLDKYGLVVVEGMNDVIRMETLLVAAVGLCSNRATDAQIEKLVRFARNAAGNRIMLMPDCDEEGEAGFKELLWKLAEKKVRASLGWSRTMHSGKCIDLQPENANKCCIQLALNSA